ncbi:MAG TPA: endonuclease/exonuclease/phosphatase family protein [Alphaproteobacteria bacterium]|nr:endonuclease/exonuclease/phosphatase family protein [Alphaproteobacteria bacterium]
MRLRLATFNLENLGDKKHGAPLAERVKALRPPLVRLDADVLCLQEIDAQPPPGAGARAHPRSLRALDALLEGTPYVGFHRAATKNRERVDYADIHNVVLLSRWPLEGVHQIWHDLVPEPQWRSSTADPPEQEPEPLVWDRPFLTAKAILPGGRALHLAGVHLRAPIAAPVPGQKLGPSSWKSIGGWAEGFVLSETKRAGQALEVRLWLDRLFAEEPDALAVVLGDFNAEEHHTPVEVILGREDNTGSGALAGSVMVAAERSVVGDRRFSVIHRGRRQMLDHILLSRALLGFYRGAEIHNEGLEDELVGHASEKPPQSFHAPVVAEFHI